MKLFQAITGASFVVATLASPCQVEYPTFSSAEPFSATSSSATPSSATPSTATFSSSTPSSSTTSNSSQGTSNLTKFAGVNMAGFDFGTDTNGDSSGGVSVPNGDQIAHFVNDDKLNLFRLPVGWQFLVNSVLGGQLSASNFAQYDKLVQSCLSAGAHCIIDIHNYARWNGGIVGQGGPTDAQLADVWSQLATKYANDSNVVFGIMNEPHDLPSIDTWGTTVQASVTAIRKAGATTQMILLPGTDYTSAGQFVSSGSLAALEKVTNPDGTTTNLLFDIHKYLDADNSGTNEQCVTDNIDDAFSPLATSLRAIGRQAILSETGGGNSQSCVQYMTSQLAFINKNTDVYLGYVGWSAGAFDTSYVLSMTPTANGNSWTDTMLLSSCFKR